MKTILPVVAALLGLWAANLSAQTPPAGPTATPVQANATLATGTRNTAGGDDDGDGWSNRAEVYLGMQPQAADQPTVTEKCLGRPVWTAKLAAASSCRHIQ